MTNIRNIHELREWLNHQPSDVPIAIASRALLRAVPLVADGLASLPSPTAGSVALSIFRACAVTRLAGLRYWPPQGPVHLATAFTYKTLRENHFPNDHVYPNNIRSQPILGQIIRSATETAHGTANTLSGQPDVGIWDSSHGIEAACPESTFWDALNTDATAIERGTAEVQLLRDPLWLTSIPENVQQDKNTLFRTLVALDPSWCVWTDWYDDILRGATHSDARLLIEDLELARALISDEDWRQGPAQVNSLIAVLEAEYRGGLPSPEDIEPQDPTAAQFQETDRKIDADDLAGRDALTTDPDARDQHAEAWRCAQVLLEVAAERRADANIPNDLLQIAQRLVQAIGETIDSVRPSLLVLRAAELLTELAADERRHNDRSGYEDPPLSAREFTAVTNANNACRIWINTDPFLAAKEAARIGQAALPVDSTQAGNLVRSAVEEGAATPEAQELIAESKNAGRSSRSYTGTVLNFFRTAARIAARTVEVGIRVAVGVGVVVSWLVRHAEPVLALLGGYPGLHDALARLIKILKPFV